MCNTSFEVIDDDLSTTTVEHFASGGRWLYTTAVLNWDLVDSGGHLDWTSESSYTNHVWTAMSKWNRVHNVIRKLAFMNFRDVEIYDTFTNKSWIGNTYSDGRIALNQYHMRNLSSNEQLSVVMHELGHALGLGHNRVTDVMCGSADAFPVELSENDIESFHIAYSRY